MKGYKKRGHQYLNWKRLVIFFIGLTGIYILATGLIRGVRASLWDGQSGFGWVIQSEEIKVKILIPDQKKLLNLVVPNETMVRVGFGFGEYRLGKVYELGKLENQAGKVLTRTVQELLGVGIHGWQVGTESNLSWWDKARLLWWEKLVIKQSETMVLKDHAAWLPENLGDGSLIYRVNQVWLDELVHQEIFDQDVAKEGLTVAVLNASGVNGAAETVSRLMSNMGVEMRLVGNLENQGQSEVLIKSKSIQDSKTLTKIINSLNMISVRVADILEYRSDLVIIIGRDYTNLQL